MGKRVIAIKEVLSDIRHKRLVVASVKRSGRNGKYAYLVIPP